MHPTVFTAALLFGLVGMATIAPAQALPLQPGTRIRLTVPCGRTPHQAPEPRQPACAVKGDLVAWRTDTLEVAADGSSTFHPLTSVSRLEVSRGYRSHWRLGAGIGFVVGAGTTFFLLRHGGSTAPCNPSANQDALRSSECVGLIGLGGLVGAGLGGLVGSRIRTERWGNVVLKCACLTPVAPRRFMLGLGLEF